MSQANDGVVRWGDDKIERNGVNFIIRDENGSTIAYVTNRVSEDGYLWLEHTVVSSQLRGHGIGGRLVQKVVEMARNEGLKIVPVCSFAVAEFKKHPEYHDVLADQANASS
ncbi:GNAT family N-acetyltransferase [Alicyclobacillus tolerans]|uniref:GNAT family N-acetyltransferase n=1 Tax=Alicyclobacillus tolerans TaxID=90970 RepID=UPI003B7E0550